MTMIYQDNKRTLTMDDHGQFVARNANGQSITIDLADESTTISETLPKGTTEALKQRGDDPMGWYTVMSHGQARGVFPPESRASMRLAIATAQAERRQIINAPANVARRKVSGLFAQAQRLQDDPGQYFPALNKARAALNNWQETYPDAAKQEQRAALLTDAHALDMKASGALVYDADGSLSHEEQDQRAAAFRAQADAKRREAEAL